MERLTKLYKEYVGSEPTEIKLMDKAGSNRSYYRLSGELSVVGVIGESREENDAFVYMARHFKQKGLSVPEVYGVSDDHMAYIQEDLGRKPENKPVEVYYEDKDTYVKDDKIYKDVEFFGWEKLDLVEKIKKAFGC